MKISITESAYQDLADIHEHYMLEGIEHIGKKHVNEVFSKIDILNDHPQIGRIVPEYGLISTPNPFVRSNCLSNKICSFELSRFSPLKNSSDPKPAVSRACWGIKMRAS